MHARRTSRFLENSIAVVGGTSLGVSLYLIHIYVAPIKRFIQTLWALGFVASLYLMSTQVQNYVTEDSLAELRARLSYVQQSTTTDTVLQSIFVTVLSL